MKYQIQKLYRDQETRAYVSSEIGYPFYLLWHFLLDMTDSAQFLQWSARIEPLTASTNSTFLLKKNQTVEIMSIFDLLQAPTNGIEPDTFSMSLQNFTEMIISWQELIELTPENIFMVLDEDNKVSVQAQLTTEQQEELHLTLQMLKDDTISCNLTELVTPQPIVIHKTDDKSVYAIITDCLRYDYQLELQNQNKYQLLDAQTDRFGVTQGYLDVLATTYLNPYQVTMFPSGWDSARLYAEVVSAYQNIIEYTHRIINHNNELERVYCIGKSSSGVLISMGINNKNKMIHLSPIFYTE